MKMKRTLAALLSALMLMTVLLTGCSSKSVQPVDSIALIDEETVLQVTPEMTRKQLYKLFGETYGQPTSGQDGFLATYIIAGRYIYSVSVFNDDSADSTLGYDGQAILNSLKNGRTLTTQRAMTVSAEDDLDKKNAKDGFKVTVDYDGKYTAYMNGVEISVKGKPVAEDKKLKGKNVLSVDVLSALEKSKKTDDAAQDGQTAPGENRLLGLLQIKNDAEESVYVEIYTIGGESYICRVRQ